MPAHALAALAVALLAASEPAQERVLVVAPRPPARPALTALSQAVASQLSRSGRRTVVPDSELRKALTGPEVGADFDLDDPSQIARVLELVGADYLVCVVSARTLIVRSAKPGAAAGRLVATAGGEAQDVALDLIGQLDRPPDATAIAPPPPLPRLSERLQIEVRVLGGAEVVAGKSDYGVSLGFEAPFTSRWSLGGSVGIGLGTATLDLRDASKPDDPAIAELDSNFRIPVAVDLRWAFLKGGNWMAQAAIGGQLSYVGLSAVREKTPLNPGLPDLLELPGEPSGYVITAGPSLAVNLGYSLSDRVQVRLGARYVAAFLATDTKVEAMVRRYPDYGNELPISLAPKSRVRHELHGFLAIDLVF